jgi:hypothetical protein
MILQVMIDNCLVDLVNVYLALKDGAVYIDDFTIGEPPSYLGMILSSYQDIRYCGTQLHSDQTSE